MMLFKRIKAQKQLFHTAFASIVNSKQATRIAITAATGQIAYSLAIRIASGEMLGINQPVILHLIDSPQSLKSATGLAMELRDCAFPLLQDVITTDSQEIGFKDVDLAILLGSQISANMDKNQFLYENGKVYKETGKFINDHSKRDIKVVVVGSPCNTNCLLLSNQATTIPKENFSYLSRLDHNRSLHMLAEKLAVSPNQIRKFCVFGNYGSTVVPYINNALIEDQKVKEQIDEQWIRQTFIPSVQQRSSEVSFNLKQVKVEKNQKILVFRFCSNSYYQSFVALDFRNQWQHKFIDILGEWTSMGVISDGSYGVPKGSLSSFPVTIQNGNYNIVNNLIIGEFYQSMLDRSVLELLSQQQAIETLLK